ncbi:hypothetical protein [Kaarinaea lacus]
MNEIFPVPTEEQLENLGAGCFVQIAENNNFVWVEIDGEEGELLTGIVHPELDASKGQSGHNNSDRVSFSREQVKYVGCDRYCFC